MFEVEYSKAVMQGVLQFMATFFVTGSMCAVIVLGCKLVQRGEITVGQITSFLFFMIQILVNFVILGQVLGSIMQIVGASDKIIELLEYEPRIKADEGTVPEATQETKGEISISDVRFNYPTKADVEVLKGVSFDIPKNKVVALVGTSGKIFTLS